MFAGVQHGERELRTPDYAERQRQADRVAQKSSSDSTREADELTARHSRWPALSRLRQGLLRPAVHGRG